MQRGWIVGIVATISACGLELAGSLGGSPTTNAADGAVLDGPSTDGASPLDGQDIPMGSDSATGTGQCDPKKPFDPPTAVSGINSARDEGNAWFTADELTAYVIIGDVGDSQSRDIYVATRPNKTAPFTTPVPVPVVNVVGAQDDNATATADGLTLYWASQRLGVGGFDLWFATRTTPTGNFGTPTIVGGINTTVNDANPFIMPNGNVLFFDSYRLPTAGGSDIYVADRLSDGGFTAGEAVLGVNSALNDFQPILTPDSLFMLFGSSRSESLGAEDLFTAERSQPSGAFGNVTHLANVNAPGTELPGWVSADRCVIYFSSDRPNGLGGRDIYRAARPK